MVVLFLYLDLHKGATGLREHLVQKIRSRGQSINHVLHGSRAGKMQPAQEPVHTQAYRQYPSTLSQTSGSGFPSPPRVVRVHSSSLIVVFSSRIDSPLVQLYDFWLYPEGAILQCTTVHYRMLDRMTPPSGFPTANVSDASTNAAGLLQKPIRRTDWTCIWQRRVHIWTRRHDFWA